jgi:DNA-binding response OmpR family regulator
MAPAAFRQRPPLRRCSMPVGENERTLILENERTLILLAEDDLPLAGMLQDQLAARGYDVYHAGSAAEAEGAVEAVLPKLVIVDLSLPNMHGLRLCANLRERTTAPIIVCSGSRRSEDRLLGFKLGADDVVTKPFSIDELAARIQVALRRSARVPSSSAVDMGVQVLGPLAIDRTRCKVTLDGDPIHLTPPEYRLLCALADRPNRVLSSQELAERVWGSEDAVLRRSLGSHLRRLRTKLKDGPVTAPALTTVRGFGYELTWEPTGDSARSQRSPDPHS